MPTTNISYPHVFSPGDLVVASEQNANNNAIRTAAETTGWDTGNLINPYAIASVNSYVATVAGLTSAIYFDVPPGVSEMKLVELQVRAAAGTFTTLIATVSDGAGLIAATPTTGAAGVTVKVSSFPRDVASGDFANVFLDVGSGSATGVNVTMFYKVLHQP